MPQIDWATKGCSRPTGTWCEDAWLTASALLAETERLKFLVAFRPGLVPPTLAAQQTATLQRFSEGRVLLNIVTGGDDIEQHRFGDWLVPRRALRPHRRVPAHRELGLDAGVGRLHRRALHREGRPGVRAAEPVAADLLRRIVARRAADRGRTRRRVSDLGRTTAGGGGQDRQGARTGRGAGAQHPVRHPACTPSAATPRRRPGPSPTNC